jgi:hypothetical protein
LRYTGSPDGSAQTARGRPKPVAASRPAHCTPSGAVALVAPLRRPARDEARSRGRRRPSFRNRVTAAGEPGHGPAAALDESDSRYSRSPTASRASCIVWNTVSRTILPSRKVQIVSGVGHCFDSALPADPNQTNRSDDLVSRVDEVLGLHPPGCPLLPNEPHELPDSFMTAKDKGVKGPPRQVIHDFRVEDAVVDLATTVEVLVARRTICTFSCDMAPPSIPRRRGLRSVIAAARE